MDKNQTLSSANRLLTTEIATTKNHRTNSNPMWTYLCSTKKTYSLPQSNSSIATFSYTLSLRCPAWHERVCIAPQHSTSLFRKHICASPIYNATQRPSIPPPHERRRLHCRLTPNACQQYEHAHVRVDKCVYWVRFATTLFNVDKILYVITGRASCVGWQGWEI